MNTYETANSNTSNILVHPEKAIIVIHENGIKIDLGKGPTLISESACLILNKVCSDLSIISKNASSLSI